MRAALQPGERLGPYVLVEPVGAGAMGVVWRAFDPRLERDVALKVLAAGALAGDAARRRFRNEALALSRLSHPNVAAVHSFDTCDGIDVLAMEFVGGAALDTDEPRTEQEVARLGIQLAEGLAAAHAAGVVHHDLKPANLRLARDGRLKILDFGIARLSAHAEVTADAATATATALDERTVAGTLPYMAPEQLRGEATDARADIWSAGVVLYELATGMRPFRGQTATHTIAAIMGGPVERPSAHRAGLSPAFDRIVARALERDPARRFASAAELADALRPLAHEAPASAPMRRLHVTARRAAVAGTLIIAALVLVAALLAWRGAGRTAEGPPAHVIDAVAVLPFADEGGSPDSRYLADEVPGAIIDALGQVPGKRVIARASSFRYRNADVDPRVVARDLGVAAVLTGRVLVRGGEVTVSAELVDSRDLVRAWGGHFTRPLAELSALPDLIAVRVAGALRGSPAGSTTVARTTRASDDPEAYRLYLRGRYELERWNDESPARALAFYRQALARDPQYARAWAGVGEALAIEEGANPARMLEARDAVDRALAIDPELAEAHAVLGFWQFSERHWTEAERELTRAAALNPNLNQAQHWLSHLYLVLGRFDEGLAAAQRYIDVDPLSPGARHHLGFVLLAMGRYDEAARTAHLVLQSDPTFQMSYENLFAADALLGRGDEAVRAFFARRGGQEMRDAEQRHLRAVYAAGGLSAFLRAVRDYYRARGSQTAGDISFLLGDDADAVRLFTSRAPDISLIDSPFLPQLLRAPRNVELRRAFGLPER